MVSEDLHRQRARARSFGAVADLYDRHRPSPPRALIDDLVVLAPQYVLDIGCGTGKASVPLIARGLSMLGVEPDPEMAAVARRNGVPVEVSTFEAWEDAGRRFDLLICCQAWHWIDPDLGADKASRLLNSGGSLAVLEDSYSVDESVGQALGEVYDRHAPEIVQVWRPRPDAPARNAGRDVLGQHPAFGLTDVRTYEWDRVLNVEDWLWLMTTVSDHRQLGQPRLDGLLEELRGVLDEEVCSHHVSRMLAARRR